MNIACLGWGSLIWKPQTLPIQKRWFTDGPLLPIEFARQSNDGRITLVITPGAQPVRSLWIPMTVFDSTTAQSMLAEREGIRKEDIPKYIGYWGATGSHASELAETIGHWAVPLGLDAVIWTNLPPKFNHREQVPTVEEVIAYLRDLPPEVQQRAEEYVRKTPFQIDTTYRRRIEAELHWTPI